MTDDPIVSLGRAIGQLAALIAGTKDDQLALPTPCQSWDVRGLIAHLLGDLANFTAQASGGTPDWAARAPEVPADPAAAFRSGADALLDAWRAAGDLSGTVPMGAMGEMPRRLPVDQQICEFAVHAWDLRAATGQHVDLDPALAEASLAWGKTVMKPEYRGDEADGKGFGPEVAVAAGAPSYDRLAGFYGRNPA